MSLPTPPQTPKRSTRRLLTVYLLASLATTWACSSPPADSRDAQPAAAPAPAAAAPRPPETSAAIQPKETRTGTASFIADRHNGQKTASGELYDSTRLVAAHPTYALGTMLRVTNQENGRVVEVKVIDRSASGANRPIVDLSRAAAEQLDFIRNGTAKVTVDVIEWGPKG